MGDGLYGTTSIYRYEIFIETNTKENSKREIPNFMNKITSMLLIAKYLEN